MNSECAAALKKLSLCCQEAHAFYTRAAQRAGDSELEKIFHKMASSRGKVVTAFMPHVSAGGDELYALEQEREQLFAALEDMLDRCGMDEAFLLCLEQTEDRFLGEFKKSLSERKMPYQTRFLLLSSLMSLFHTNEEFKSLRLKRESYS